MTDNPDRPTGYLVSPAEMAKLTRPQIALTLPAKMRAELDRISTETGQGRSELIREAVREWLARRKREER